MTNQLVKTLTDSERRLKYLEVGQRGKMSIRASLPLTGKQMDMVKVEGVVYMWIENGWIKIGEATDVAQGLLETPLFLSHTYTVGGHALTWDYPGTEVIDHYELYEASNQDEDTMAFVGNFKTTATTMAYSTGILMFGLIAVAPSGARSPVGWSDVYIEAPLATTITAELVQAGFFTTWDSLDNAKSYELEAAEDNVGTNSRQVWAGTSLMSPLIEQSRPWFRVRGVGWAGGAGDWSDWVTDDNAPPAPTIAITSGIESVTISIAPSDASHLSAGFSHYVIERSADSGGGSPTTLDTHAIYAAFPYVTSQPSLNMWYRLTPYDLAGNQGTSTAWTPGTVTVVEETGSSVQDRFDGYGGLETLPLESLWWLKLADMDTDENWVSALFGSVSPSGTHVEGNGGVLATPSGGISSPALIFGSPVDFDADGRWTSDDKILVSVYQTTTAVGNNFGIALLVREYGSSWTASSYTIFEADHTQGWHYYIFPKSSVSEFDWSNVDGVGVVLSTDYGAVIDDLRIVKADPADPTTYNDTGNAWDKAVSTYIAGDTTGEWHIYEGNRPGEPSKPFSYGQIRTEGDGFWYLSYKPLETTDIITGTIQAGIFLKNADRSGGLAFFVQDVGLDTWEMYTIVVRADDTNNIYLAKWIAGNETSLANVNIPFAIEQTVWVGVDFREFSSDAGRLKVYVSLTEGNLIQASNLVISLQDTGLSAGGSVGLLSQKANVRFVNFRAGSPAHAETADVCFALDGTWIGGETRRLIYSRDSDAIVRSDDGLNCYALYPPAVRVMLPILFK